MILANELYGPFGESLELASSLSADPGERVPIDDEHLLVHFLRELLESPMNREALRHAALTDPLSWSGPMDDESLLRMIAHRISIGDLILVRPQATEGVQESRGANLPVGPGGDGDASHEEQAPPEQEVKIKDWKLECAHHTSKGRDLIERGTRIAVVPDKGTTKDTVKVHWRDDWQASMPPSLAVRIPGRAEGKANKGSGGPGGYTTYGLEAEYLGDVDIINILNPGFWRAYAEKTTHTIQPGPTSIGVDVYNPRQFKFEFKLPPMAGFKDGSKYEASGAKEVKALAKGGKLVEKHTTEDAYWSPSSLTLDSHKTDSHPGPDFEPNKSEMAFGESIKLERDGAAVDLDVLKVVGSILEFADAMREIVKMVKDYAPKVGWYIDWNLQLMQGALAVEWYWKEHTDARVFQYIDFNIALTIFSLTFEIGIGVSACSFKLQIYAQLSGEVGIEAGAKRDSPDGAPGFKLPTLKGKIKGTLGARAEAGYLFKFEAKGETAIETECGIGINQRGSMVSIDARARWTGIECTASFSTGLLGISYSKVKKLTLVGESPWWGLSWPEEKEYVPPTLSRDRIQSVVTGVLEDGWNVRVFDGDDQLEMSTVAGMIADRVERDSAFDKTQKMVDALANGIRQDLDVLGVRDWGRDYVTLADLRSYLGGSVRGLGLPARLEAGASPTRKLMAANA